MTKEELKQEAEEVARQHWLAYPLKQEIFKQGYLASAEPREKQIADLEDKLANADYQLEGRDNEIRELKEKIEKMKCCDNCKFGQNRCYLKDGTGNACEEWEMK